MSQLETSLMTWLWGLMIMSLFHSNFRAGWFVPTYVIRQWGGRRELNKHKRNNNTRQYDSYSTRTCNEVYCNGTVWYTVTSVLLCAKGTVHYGVWLEAGSPDTGTGTPHKINLVMLAYLVIYRYAKFTGRALPGTQQFIQGRIIQ